MRRAAQFRRADHWRCGGARRAPLRSPCTRARAHARRPCLAHRLAPCPSSFVASALSSQPRPTPFRARGSSLSAPPRAQQTRPRPRVGGRAQQASRGSAVRPSTSSRRCRLTTAFFGHPKAYARGSAPARRSRAACRTGGFARRRACRRAAHGRARRRARARAACRQCMSHRRASTPGLRAPKPAEHVLDPRLGGGLVHLVLRAALGKHGVERAVKLVYLQAVLAQRPPRRLCPELEWAEAAEHAHLVQPAAQRAQLAALCAQGGPAAGCGRRPGAHRPCAIAERPGGGHYPSHGPWTGCGITKM